MWPFQTARRRVGRRRQSTATSELSDVLAAYSSSVIGSGYLYLRGSWWGRTLTASWCCILKDSCKWSPMTCTPSAVCSVVILCCPLSQRVTSGNLFRSWSSASCPLFPGSVTSWCPKHTARWYPTPWNRPRSSPANEPNSGPGEWMSLIRSRFSGLNVAVCDRWIWNCLTNECSVRPQWLSQFYIHSLLAAAYLEVLGNWHILALKEMSAQSVKCK